METDHLSKQMYHRAVELLEAEINDEMVALEPTQGSCFGFSEVAKVVWRKLEQPCSFEVIRDELLEEYDVGEEQCSLELRELLDTMAAAKLVERTEA